MDLLYNNEQYEQVMHVMDSLNEQQIEFGTSCATVAIAACHKLVGLSYLLTSLMLTISSGYR